MYIVFLQGRARRLVWGADNNGRYRAKEYFEGLQDADRAKFQPWFERVAETTAPIANTEKFRMESPNLFVFKIFKHRIACFFDQRDVVLIHGFVKKATTSKRVARELSTAERLRDDYLERKKTL